MRGIIVCLASLALVGCNQPSQAPTGDLMDDPTAALHRNVSMLGERVDHLQKQVLDLRLEDRSVVYLTPDDHGFAGIQSRVGRLTISLKDVSAFANGSRIRLRFGNPLAATITRFKAHIAYGTGEDGAPQSTRREIDHVFSETLRPGAWRTYTVDLAAIPPSQLGFVTVSRLDVESMSLETE